MLPITRTTTEEIAACPIRQVLVKAANKWQILIFFALEDGTLRFGQIKSTIGEVTQRVLAENLRKMERDGYLARNVHPGPPVAVFYELTPMGKSFTEVIKPAALWASEHFPKISEHRRAYDKQRDP